MDTKYKNPPIIEAVCEFYFAKELEWDMTIPGLVYNKIRKEYPNKDQRIIGNFELEFKPGEIATQKFQQNTSPIAMFFDKDRKSLVQVGERLFTVNHLKRYSGWKVYKAQIENAYKALLSIISDKASLERIGLHYINQIHLEQVASNQLKDYLIFLPNLGDKLPREYNAFNLNCEFPFNGNRDVCQVTINNQRAIIKSTSLILDINYFLRDTKSIAIQDAMDWVETAHTNIENIFEGCITDLLREKFA